MAQAVVRDIMMRQLQHAKLDATLVSIAEQISSTGAGSVIVNLGVDPGIITERDLAHQCVTGKKNIFNQTAKDAMSTPLITIPATSPIFDAANLMKEKNIKKLVVTEDGRFVGIVTMTDIIRNIDLIGNGFKPLPTREIMNWDLYCADADDRVMMVAELMRRVEAGSLIIMEKGSPIGIMTERDIVRNCGVGERDFFKLKTRDIFSKSLISVGADADVLDAAHIMRDRNIKKLVVTGEDKQIIGIVTQTDVIFNLDRFVIR